MSEKYQCKKCVGSIVTVSTCFIIGNSPKMKTPYMHMRGIN